MGKLADLFSEFFESLLIFRDMAAEDRPNHEVLRQKICAMLDRAEARSRELQIPPSRFQSAKFAAVAYADELILSTPWVYRKEWLANTLQMTYFQTHTAGELFFRNLQSIGDEEKDLLEVYYLCLCLGFKGELMHDPARLITLRREVLQRLDPGGMALDSPLTPQAYATAQKEVKTHGRFPSYLWALVPVTGVLGLYVLLRSLVQGRVTELLRIIGY